MKKIETYIITGHKGLIGEYLKKELDKKYQCQMEVDLRSGFNVLNLNSCRLNLDTQRTDLLVHTAAHCKIQEGVEYPELPHINNANGIHSVLEFCRKNKIPRIMSFSSSRVLSPEESTYTASKKYVENLTRAYHDCYGLEYTIVRPSTVYGPVHDITSRLISTWVQNALENKPLLIFGDKKKTLDFTYVTDFVDGCSLIIDNWDKTKNNDYNISGENEVNLTDLARLILKETKSKSKIIYRAPEVAQPQQVRVDISKMKALGYKPKHFIDDGVMRLIEFYQKEKNKTRECIH